MKEEINHNHIIKVFSNWAYLVADLKLNTQLKILLETNFLFELVYIIK